MVTHSFVNVTSCNPKPCCLPHSLFPLGCWSSSINNSGNYSNTEWGDRDSCSTGVCIGDIKPQFSRNLQKYCHNASGYSGTAVCRVFLTDLTYELFPTMQVGGPENVVSFQWFQQKVVPNAGDTVRGVRGLRRAGRPEVGAETLARLCSP